MLGDVEGFIQIKVGTHRSEKPTIITGTDKIHLKLDCIQGSIVIGVREPILYSFALDEQPGHQMFKEPRIKLFKKINKHVLSHISFFLEDDVHKAVYFDGDTIRFTCQLIKL